ncbi:MAG: hypothetical protein Q8N09_02990 [Thermodesulfovibrionia bacterium]|nr:hypothetical protein [Thermodesulfovibrionia bacterium]
MKLRTKKYKDMSPVDFLVLKDRLGFGKYRKRIKRDKEEREILIDLGLKKMKEEEKNNFIPVGDRRRRLKIL